MAAVRFCLDSLESELELIRMLRGAQVHVYYSSFVMILDKPLAQTGPTLQQLFGECASRGVPIYMLYNEETAYGNLKPDALRAALPPNVHVQVIVGSGKLSLSPAVSSMLRLQNTRYSNHHQKYIFVDDAEAMITGVDVNEQRQAWLESNADNYAWHEISVVLPCTPAMASFARANFETPLVEVPPFPLTRGPSEYKLLLRLIDTARNYVHMEQQTCVSASSTSNRVFDHVAQRVARAWKSEVADPFCFMFLTNRDNPDESKFISYFIKQQLLWSCRYMLNRCKQLGVPAWFVKERVFLGSLRTPDGRYVKIHSNVTIADGVRLLRSSSNLSDRSMSVFPCDSELGCYVFDPPSVSRLQTTLWARYLLTPDPMTPQNVLHRMAAGTGMVQPLLPTVYNNLYHTLVANVLCDLVNLVPAFGGKKRITWSSYSA